MDWNLCIWVITSHCLSSTEPFLLPGVGEEGHLETRQLGFELGHSAHDLPDNCQAS